MYTGKHSRNIYLPSIIGILLFVGFVVLGFYSYQDLKAWEEQPLPSLKYMNSIESLIYSLAGKSGVLIFSILGGLLFLIGGIKTTKANLKLKKRSHQKRQQRL